MGTEPKKTFDPAAHFRKVKGGQDYLEVKFRLIWWREEHPEGYVTTDLVHADYDNGYYVVKATVGWMDESGRDVHATAHKSEAVRDFAEALEKAETGAIGRALAMLGYGTAQALEFDEGDRLVDSPVERSPKPRTPLAVVPAPVDVEALRTEVLQRLESDPDAASKLPKPAAAMTEAELVKTTSWLSRRARVLSS